MIRNLGWGGGWFNSRSLSVSLSGTSAQRCWALERKFENVCFFGALTPSCDCAPCPWGTERCGRVPGGARALPSCARGLPSLLALASRCGLELPKARQRAGSVLSELPLSGPPAVWDHRREARPPGPFPLLSPLSPGHLRGVAFPASLAWLLLPGLDLTFHTDGGAHSPLRAPALCFPTQLALPAPCSVHTPPHPPLFTETQTERSPGGFLRQTTVPASVGGTDALLPAGALGACGTEEGVQGEGPGEEQVCVTRTRSPGDPVTCPLAPRRTGFCTAWHYMLSPISASRCSSDWRRRPCRRLSAVAHPTAPRTPTAPSLIISCRDCTAVAWAAL